MINTDSSGRGISLYAALAAALLFLFSYSLYRTSLGGDEFPVAKKGVLNYQPLAFSENGKLLLKGEWEFYGNRFYFPGDFRAAGGYPLPGRKFVAFPQSWSRVPSGVNDDGMSSSFGYATYRLKITGLSSSERYGLLVPVINSSYTLWINGRRMLNSGLVGTESPLSIPSVMSRVIAFTAESGEISLVIHVSNFQHGRGGPLGHILLGRDDEVTEADAVNIVFSAMAIVLSLMTIVFLLFLDIKYRKYHKEVFPILLFTVLALRFSLSDSLLLLRLFPSIPWEYVSDLKYIFTYSLGLLVLLVVTEIDNRRRMSRPVMMLIISFAALTGFIVLAPAKLYTKFNLLFDAHQLFCYGYTAKVLYEHFRKKAPLVSVHIFLSALFALFYVNIRLYMSGLVVTEEVSISSVIDLFFKGQYHSQSATPLFVFFSFFPYFFIFCLYMFAKVDHLIQFFRDEQIPAQAIPEDRISDFDLTDREKEILIAVLSGSSNQEIADKCFISLGTVKNHLSHIYRKTGCSNRSKLIRLFSGRDYI